MMIKIRIPPFTFKPPFFSTILEVCSTSKIVALGLDFPIAAVSPNHVPRAS